MDAALEQAIQDRLGEGAIMQYVAEGRQRFVRRQEHGLLGEVAFIDDAIEHVRGVGRVREVPEFIDHEHVRVQKGRERGVEPSLGRGARQFPDQRIRADEVRLVAVLDRATAAAAACTARS